MLILLQRLDVFNKLELYMMPIHYYYPIPDFDKIRGDEFWDSKANKIPGIELNEEYQLQLLRDEFPKYVTEYGFPLQKRDVEHASSFYFDNHMFANTDAEVYYCMIRHFKPRIIIEIGGGRSTQICHEASKRNSEVDKIQTQMIVIDPYPNREILIPMSKDLITLIESKVEEIDLDVFQKLHENDILFIDSSHVVKSGGDVNCLFLEVIPRLNPGVIIHIHDIRIPYEVTKGFILDQGRFFTEQYLLHAFLIGNRDFEILLGTYFMTKNFQEIVAHIFRSSGGGKYAGSSFWIRRKTAA